MPDLISGFNRIYKKPIFETESKSRSGRSIKQGVERHLAVDQIFHNSPQFKRSVDRIKEILYQADLQTIQNRVYFLAHVYYEIMLDRILIKLYPDLPVKYYHLLEEIDHSSMNGYFLKLKTEDHNEEFFKRFSAFIKHRYLFSYVDNDSLVFALCRVYQRISTVEVTLSDQVKLRHTIEEIESYIAPLISGIFDEIKTQLK